MGTLGALEVYKHPEKRRAYTTPREVLRYTNTHLPLLPQGKIGTHLYGSRGWGLCGRSVQARPGQVVDKCLAFTLQSGDFVYAHPEQGLGVGTLCTQSGDFVYAHPLLWLTAIREKWWLPEVLTRIFTRRRGCGNGGYVDTCTEAVFSR